MPLNQTVGEYMYYVVHFQSSIYQEVMAMFYQISILSSAPYGSTEKDEKVKGYR